MSQTILETTVFYVQAALFGVVMLLSCIILFKKIKEAFKKY